MSLTSDLIKERIAAEVAPRDLALAAGLIEDSLPPAAGLDAINAAITKARAAYGTAIFNPVPAPASEPATASMTAGTPAQQRRQAHQANALEAALERVGGNPFVGAGNVTVAALLQARDPARATRLRAEAGK